MSSKREAALKTLLDRYGRTYAQEAGIRLADRPSPLWPLLWACIGVAVLAVPVGLAMGVMDDTVTWEDPLTDGAGTGDAGPDPADIVSPPPAPPLMVAATPVSTSSPPGAGWLIGRKNRAG